MFLIDWLFRNNDKQTARTSPAFLPVLEAGCGYRDARSIPDFQQDRAQVFPPNQECASIVGRGCCALLLRVERDQSWSASSDFTRGHFRLCSFDFIP